MKSAVKRFFNTDDSIDLEICPKNSVGAVFLNDDGVFGILLIKRGLNDEHICFELISEDDGHWFSSYSGVASSSWLEALEKVIAEAKQWCEKNGVPNVQHGRQYGWNFPKGTKFYSVTSRHWKKMK